MHNKYYMCPMKVVNHVLFFKNIQWLNYRLMSWNKLFIIFLIYVTNVSDDDNSWKWKYGTV